MWPVGVRRLMYLAGEVIGKLGFVVVDSWGWYSWEWKSELQLMIYKNVYNKSIYQKTVIAQLSPLSIQQRIANA